MRGRAILYALGAVVVTAMVMLVGITLAGPDAREGVLVGGAVALGLQLVIFWLLEVFLFPQRRLLVFGLGMGMRLLAFALAVLVLIPSLGLPLAPTLLTLVAVFVLTNLLEPVIHQAAPLTGS